MSKGRYLAAGPGQVQRAAEHILDAIPMDVGEPAELRDPARLIG